MRSQEAGSLPYTVDNKHDLKSGDGGLRIIVRNELRVSVALAAAETPLD
jgi:hypothetical protein